MTTPRTLRWKPDDGGRWAAGFRPRGVGDCVTRSIAIATGVPYAKVVDMINEMALERGRKTYKTRPASLTKDDIEDLLAGLGWKYVKMPRGIHLSPGELPEYPVLIAYLGCHHLTAVVNGVIHDTWNSALTRYPMPGAKIRNRYLVRGIYLPLTDEHVRTS